MRSLNISNFLFQQVENTIIQKRFIKKVEIKFEFAESFGNEYIKLSYNLTLNKHFHSLSPKEHQVVSETFTGSPNYIFSLTTHSQNYSQEKYIFSKIEEFNNIYLSLTSYVSAQLEKHLHPNTTIFIQGVDFQPEINYAKKYLKELNNYYGRYKDISGTNYNTDIMQYKSICELYINSTKLYRKEKSFFNVTDLELANLEFLDLNSIRQILINWNVPIKIFEIKTLDKIQIHSFFFVQALKKEIKKFREDDTFSIYAQERINRTYNLLEYVYDNYIPEEKEKIIEQQKINYPKNFPVQKGDILELKNKQLVIIEDIFLNKKDDKTEIKYCLLKTNLEKSSRKRIIKLENILYYIKSDTFKEYQNNSTTKHISLLKIWMKKRKIEIYFPHFKLDLTQ